VSSRCRPPSDLAKDLNSQGVLHLEIGVEGERKPRRARRRRQGWPPATGRGAVDPNIFQKGQCTAMIATQLFFVKKIALLWIGDPKLEVHVNSYFQFFTKPPTYQFENKT
jgi:hypothetical protein